MCGKHIECPDGSVLEGELVERIRWVGDRQKEMERKKRRKQMQERVEVPEPVGAD